MKAESELIPFEPIDPVGKRVLVLAPHPDDETIGCGGTLALHRMANDPVRVVFLTDGSKGAPDGCISEAQCAQKRRKEAIAACGVLGIPDVVFWDYPDRELCDARCSLSRLIDMIEDFRPERIYVPSILEFHPDHRMAACLIADAASSLSGFADVEVWMVEINQPVCVNTIVDITPVLDRKTTALACYASQLQVRPYDAVSLALNRFRSLTLPQGCTHAEGFFRCTLGDIREKGLFGLSIVSIDRYRPAPCEAGPLVSILIRTKDRPQHLTNALRSVVEQSYRHIEIVVVNDGGTDVRSLAEREARGVPVTYVRHEVPKGRAAAANSALAAAKGAWLNFLDDDDILYPEHVETLIRKLQSCGGDAAYAGVRNCYYRSIDAVCEGPVREEIRFNHPWDPDVLLFENYLPIMSVLFSRAALERMERWFDEDLILFEDWDFWIRLSRGRTFHHVDAITAEYRIYGAENIDEAHHSRYDYDAAKAALFDRAKPWMDGKAWLRFLRHGVYGELIRRNESLKKEVLRLERLTKEIGNRFKELETRNFAEQQILKVEQNPEREQTNQCGLRALYSRSSIREPHPNDRLDEWVWLSGWLKRCWHWIEIIRYFDGAWYCRQYPDVAVSGMSPFLHFLIHGMWEGRKASPLSLKNE